MKILYVLNSTTLVGGGNKSFLRLLERVRKEHEVKVICPNEREITPYLRSKGIDVEVVCYEFATYLAADSLRNKLLWIPRMLRRLWRNRCAVPKIEAIARAFGPDIIQSNCSVIDVGSRVARRLGVPHVLHVREYGNCELGWHHYGLQKRLTSPGSYSICITRDIARVLGVEGRSTNRCIYNPIVDESEICEISPKEDYFLYAGRIDPDKGIADLIDGYILYCREAKGKILPLKMAGAFQSQRQQSLKQEMERRLKKEGLADYVEWLGEIKDIYSLMRAAKACIIPSYMEGFGRVMPEAQSQGCLTIVRNAGGLKEQLDNGMSQTGHDIALMFDDVEGLAKSLHQVREMSDNDVNVIIGLSQKTVRNLYTNAASASQTLEFYDYIAGEYPSKNK